MDIKYMRAFIAFAESDSLTQAARTIGISKGLLWKYIDRVETELGVPLFERSGKKSWLNENGRLFLKTAQQIVAEVDQCAENLQSYKNNTLGADKLVIGTFPIMTPYHITDRLIDFQRAYPELEIKVNQDDEAMLEADLEKRRMELAFMRSWSDLDGRYTAQLFCRDEACIALPANHPLAKQEYVTWKQLTDEKFLLLLEGGMTYRECWHRCESEGFRPIMGGTFIQADTVFRMVGQGMGISFLLNKPRRRYGHIPNVVFKRLSPPCCMNIYLAYLKRYGLSEVASDFWRYISENNDLNGDQG